MELQKLYSYLRQAMQDYNMISEGDRIAVGLSGGIDSLTLLYGLGGLRKFYPEKFDIVGITVDLGYDGADFSNVARLCEELGVEYHIVHTQIADMMDGGKCSLCARLRKGAFNKKAIDLQCNKIAYAHNLDDVVETLMLSLMYEGRFSTFWPVTEYDDSKIFLIRPMIYVPKSRVMGFGNKYNLKAVKNPCPYEKNTQRSYVRKLLENMEKHAPGTKNRMLTAVKDGSIAEWNKELNKKIQ